MTKRRTGSRFERARDFMKKKEWKRVLFVPTGALLSTVSFNEGNSIPGIAHAVMLEGISGSGKGVGEWTM